MSKTRIKELEELIIKNKKLYYTLGLEPEISDEEYDLLENELKNLDPDNKVLKMVGSNFFSQEKVAHQKKMLSLDKTYDQNELIKWSNEKEVLMVYKIDGNSCSLIYENNKLYDAKTRGDGEFGERILFQANYIPDIPKNINLDDVEVRGEIYCTKDNFDKLCEEMQKRQLEIPSNMRNIVSGILGRKENRDLAEYLNFFAFEIVGKEMKTEKEQFDVLMKNGFSLPPHKFYKKLEKTQLEKDIKNMTNFMNNGDYLIDGLVYSFNDWQIHKELGSTGHHPKYKKAFKIAGEMKETILKDILWQISKKGVYTPVGILEPVELSGALVSRATLHNLKHVIDHNLGPGDTIKLVRSGEVIPKFLEVTKSSGKKFKIPSHCEFCDEQLNKDEVRLFCNNKDCVGKKDKYLIDFAKKIGIDDLSEKRIKLMIEQGLITKPSDFYHLKKEELLNLDKIKDKMASKILKNIEKTKNTTAIKFFDSLNFTGGAKNKIELLQKEGYDSIEKLMNLKVGDLVNIKGFQEKSAQDFLDSLNHNKNTIEELIKSGLQVKFETVSAELSGISFCITGNVSIKRGPLTKLLKSKGADVVGSVSNNTSFLICNSPSNSGKSKDAKNLGIPIITEEELKLKFNLEY